MKYLQNRGRPCGRRKVWAFLGDGECDEPEALGALALAGREKLDNLIFVVNCNLQRLDGPVRGNGKIIQELEGYFRGAGWNVIKVVWGRLWDPLLARDEDGILQQAMDDTVDGEFQNFKAKGGAYVREHFFGQHPQLSAMVSDMTDEDIYRLNRGGHDPYKIYAAYRAAVLHEGQPTVILAKTIKGYGMGDAGESENTTHQVKKLNLEELKQFRDRFDVPLSDKQLRDIPYFRPADDSAEMAYLRERRAALGGSMPRRLLDNKTLEMPPLSAFAAQLKGSGERDNTVALYVSLQLWYAIRILAPVWCPLCLMRRARSGWKVCSDSWVSIFCGSVVSARGCGGLGRVPGKRRRSGYRSRHQRSWSVRCLDVRAPPTVTTCIR